MSTKKMTDYESLIAIESLILSVLTEFHSTTSARKMFLLLSHKRIYILRCILIAFVPLGSQRLVIYLFKYALKYWIAAWRGYSAQF